MGLGYLMPGHFSPGFLQQPLYNLDSVSNILCVRLTGRACLKCGIPESPLRDSDL